MSRGLVGHDVGRNIVGQEARQNVGRVGDQPDRQRSASSTSLDAATHGIGVVRGELVEVAGLDAALGPLGVDLDAEGHPIVHRDRQRLGATHPT